MAGKEEFFDWLYDFRVSTLPGAVGQFVEGFQRLPGPDQFSDLPHDWTGQYFLEFVKESQLVVPAAPGRVKRGRQSEWGGTRHHPCSWWRRASPSATKFSHARLLYFPPTPGIPGGGFVLLPAGSPVLAAARFFALAVVQVPSGTRGGIF